jgi:hypothetical protein
MLFLAPTVLVLAVVARISGLVEPFLAIVLAVPVYFLLMALDPVVRFPRFGGHPMIEAKEVFTWPKRRRRTQLSSGVGWWSWSGRVEARRSLAKEFEPSANTIRKWATQADIDEGLRADGLTTAERNELRDLRRENKQLKLEREILGGSLPAGGRLEGNEEGCGGLG